MSTNDLPAQPSATGRLGPFFAAIWLVFMLDPLLQAVDRGGVRGWAGVAVTVAFCVAYLAVWWVARQRIRSTNRFSLPSIRESVLTIGVLAALATALMLLIGEPGIAALVYVGVAVVMTSRVVVAFPAVLGIAAVTAVLGLTVPGWDTQFGTSFGVVAAATAVFGIRSIIQRNSELLAAQEANAELLVENERSRFARDLHDILGHSLTVIALKAELAGRLFDADPERVRHELADLERLSRDALADVRRAVEGYRGLTLPGELARARTALAAADIEARLPNSTDEVPSELRELFAWTVREGVTNVLKHSGARRCEVVLEPSRAEVRDDGPGPTTNGSGGSGLRGLEERAAAVGATVVTRRLDPGWSLAVVRS